jgi:hypothetical protein
MLECLKAIDGHVFKNILKRCQNVVDNIPISKAIILSSNFVDPKGFPNTSINSKGSLGDVERFMTKVEMLHSLSKSMATMASCFAFAFKI